MRKILAVATMLYPAALGVSSVSAQTTPGQPATDLAAAFGARESIQQISLSPDGNKIAYITPTRGRGAALSIIDATNGNEKVVLTSSGNPDRLTDCHWSTDSRLICNVYMILDTGDGKFGFTRIVAVNSDGGGVKVLSARTNERSLGVAYNGGDLIDWGGDGTGSVLMTRVFIPEETTGTIVANNRSGLGVELIDTATLSRKTVEPPHAGAVDFITDGRGNIRVMGIQSKDGSGYDSNKLTYMYRPAGEHGWKTLTTLTIENGRYRGFYPVAVDPTLNVAYGLSNEDGRTGSTAWRLTAL